MWARLPKEGCGCGLGKACDHGPPRLANAHGEPYALRAIQVMLAKVKLRLRARLAQDREENRALAVARFDAAFAMAAEQGAVREAIGAAARRAELDGSHLAAEEAGRPDLYQRVRALMFSVVDYEPPEQREVQQLSPEASRYQLQRLERLLLAADDGTARYERLGGPPGTEAERLTWRRNLLDEAVHQTMTSPHVSPREKRDMIVRAVVPASMITEGADLAERVTALEKKASE